MEKEEFKKTITFLAKEIDIEFNEEQVEKFYKYMQLLLEWNEKINLTAITNPKEIILKHFIDSLTILKYIKKGANVIDVGTGAGFPGIPLKILRDDINLTLLDSLNKRINFLKLVIDELKLKNVDTIHGRAEEIGKNKRYRESFDISFSRAVANLSTLSEYLIPLVKIGGISISMKGAEIKEEIEKSKKAITLLGGNINKIDFFELPQSDIKRNLIIIEKERSTPAKFPRKPGLPSKEPIL